MLETRFNPWVGKIPWRRKWQPTLVLLPGKSHGQRSLVGYSPWGHKESDTTEWLYLLKQRPDDCEEEETQRWGQRVWHKPNHEGPWKTLWGHLGFFFQWLTSHWVFRRDKCQDLIHILEGSLASSMLRTDYRMVYTGGRPDQRLLPIKMMVAWTTSLVKVVRSGRFWPDFESKDDNSYW